MVHDVDAIYDQGVFRPMGPLALPEGTRVHLRVEEQNGDEASAANKSDNEGPTLLERLKNVVGSVDDLPDDSSINLDHYLYGRPTLHC
jgi:predicted DNA-binding antitoxin AbrB/MazE fold protein